MPQLVGSYLYVPGVITNLETGESCEINDYLRTVIISGDGRYAIVFEEHIELRHFGESENDSVKIARAPNFEYSFTKSHFIGISNETSEVQILNPGGGNMAPIQFNEEIGSEITFTISSQYTDTLYIYTDRGSYYHLDISGQEITHHENIGDMVDALCRAALNCFDFPAGYSISGDNNTICLNCDDWDIKFTRTYGTVGAVLVNTAYIVLECTNFDYTSSVSDKFECNQDVRGDDGLYMVVKINNSA